MADSRLAECIDYVISEYLSVGDPDSCCEKLEKILMLGLDEQLEIGEGKQHSKFILHPLHHLSLIAYTTLASAYKVRGSDLLCVGSEINLDQFEAFDMSRISAAYSLLLAGATHHLFKFESSLIASIANFWTGAGESLLSLTRNSGWNKFVELGLVVSKLPSIRMLKCSKCSLMVRFRACISNGQIKSADFETVSNEFLHCVSHITQKVWSVLVYGCNFMRSCKDPINFSWLWSTKNSITVDIGPHGNKTNTGNTRESENNIHICEGKAYNDHVVNDVFLLSVHCLTYGGLLASICYGPHSHLSCHVQNILGELYCHDEI